MNCLRTLMRLHQSSIYKISSVRYISHHPMQFEEKQDKWRENDGVSKRWQLIYKAPMGNTLKIVSTYLTLTTATIGVGSLYYAAYVFDFADMDSPVILGGDIVLANNSTECLIYLSSFVLFHLAVKILLSKYVARLYQDGNKYLAVFPGHIYNSVIKHEFHAKDVKKLKPTLFVAWGDARYDLGNKHAILLETYFKTPEYFNNLAQKKNKEVEDDSN